ncbi:hypothetical protein EMMF5_002047 [Cystobasidiomycetes sp. EMM_F5]
MASTMRAVLLDSAPAPPEGLKIVDLPVPKPGHGEVLIIVKAFGLNRSGAQGAPYEADAALTWVSPEYHTRKGLAEGVTFPRVLGIEATGVVAECPGGEFAAGDKVVTMMGGMGRTRHGGYAEMTCVLATNVIKFEADNPDWGQLGALPEMLQTALGSLDVGCDGKAGQSILIRGGTSSVGMCAAVLAKQRRMTVLSTTRNARKSDSLKKIGVDHVIIDDGAVSEKVRDIQPDGVDCAIELVGATALRDTLRAIKVKGTACFTGMLNDDWTIKDMYPMEFIPKGVRLTSYGGGAEDLTREGLQSFIDALQQGVAKVPIDTVYEGLEKIVEAHKRMEDGHATGKLVVLTGK